MKPAHSLSLFALVLFSLGSGPCDTGIPIGSAQPDAAMRPSDLAVPITDAAVDPRVHFFPDIQQDLVTLGCSAGGACHGNVQLPTFKPYPLTQMDRDVNYRSFTDNCNTTSAADSPVIQNALGNLGHTGGALMKTTDPQYQRWIDWITAGELE